MKNSPTYHSTTYKTYGFLIHGELIDLPLEDLQQNLQISPSTESWSTCHSTTYNKSRDSSSMKSSPTYLSMTYNRICGLLIRSELVDLPLDGLQSNLRTPYP